MAPAITAISFIIFLVFRRKFNRTFENDHGRRRLYLWGGILAALLQLMPFFGFFITDAACFHQGQTRASKIISAVEAYRSGHDDSFPATVEVLVPDYLGEIPEPACSWMTGDDGYRAGLRCMNAVPARFC